MQPSTFFIQRTRLLDNASTHCKYYRALLLLKNGKIHAFLSSCQGGLPGYSLRLMLAGSLTEPIPALTLRKTRVPGTLPKALPSIVVRRGAKTTFL